MKSVLISICPKWVDKIVSGEKTIEVRKTAPKEVPFKCYIYMTQGTYKDLGLYSEWIYKNRMKVIGEFICDKVYNLVNAFGGIMFADENLNQLDPQLFRDMSCLTDEQTADYLGEKDGYGWHISELKFYDKPKPIMQFYKPCPIEWKNCPVCEFYSNYTGCCMNNINRPPQSYMYVEEVKQ